MTKPLFLLVAFLLTSCANHVNCKLSGPAQPPCHENMTMAWEASDGKWLPLLAELPKSGKPKAVVIIVPGLDGTLCDYKSLTRALVQHGYAVYGSENRSMRYDSDPKARGAACDWKLWVADLNKLTDEVRKRHPHVPIYYHGHSFGAVIAMETMAENANKPRLLPKGFIAQSPAFALLPEQNPWLIRALLWPAGGFHVPILSLMESRKLELTRCEKFNCAWMQSSDRVAKGYTIGWFRQVLTMGHKARAASKDLQIPVLALEGQKDYITLGGKPCQIGSLKQKDYEDYLHKQLANGLAKVKPYKEGRHLLTEGPGKEEVIRDIIAWLDAHP